MGGSIFKCRNWIDGSGTRLGDNEVMTDTKTQTPRKYYDMEGDETTLFKLVRAEPDWAVNQILHRDKLETELVAAKDCLQSLYDLQNGCPLPKYEDDWNKAMAKAKEILG